MKVSNAYKNEYSLQYALDNPENVEGMTEHLETIETQEIDSVKDFLLTDLSWLDYHGLSNHIKDSIADPDDGERLEFEGWETNYMTFEHRDSHHVFYQVGDTITPGTLDEIDNQNLDENCVELTFIGTFSYMSEEIELQAENGAFAYHYLGAHYLEIWLDSRFYKQGV